MEKPNHAEVTETGPENRMTWPKFSGKHGRDSGRIPTMREQARLLSVLLIVGFLALLALTSTVTAPSNIQT